VKVQLMASHLQGIYHDDDIEWLCDECGCKQQEIEIFYIGTKRTAVLLLCSQCLPLLHSMTSPLSVLIKANINTKV
jgi:hypothetical protein